MISFRRVISRTLSTGAGKASALLAVTLLGLSAAPRAEARLLVSDYGSHSIALYNGGTGAFIDTFAPQSSGGLQNPNSLAYGPDGNLYVTDTTNVLRFNGLTGAFLDIFVPADSGGLQSPAGLAFGPDGNLYVASKTTHSVLRYDGHTGAFIDAFVPAHSGGLSYPYGLTFGPDHNLYVVNSYNSSVLRYNGLTGAFIDTFVSAGSGGLNGSLDLTFGPDGNLYISSYYTGSILRYSGQTGAFIDAFVPAHSGGLAQPEGVAFAPDGNLYVASLGTHSILRYNGWTGAFIDTFVAPGTSPTTPRCLLFTLDAPSGLIASAVSSTQINLSWTDNSDDETAFAIWRKGSAGNWTRVGVVLPNVTTFSDTNLPPNSSFTYRVRAISIWIASAWTDQVTATTFQAPPAAPFSLTATAISPTEITLNWFDNSDNETAFAVWRKTGAGSFVRVAVLAANTTSYTDFGLNPSTTYTYRVRATNDFYASDWTNEATRTTLALPSPAAPTDLTASLVAGSSQVNLSWTNHPSTAIAYEIYRKPAGGSYILINDVGPGANSFSDLYATGGVAYTYRVRAVSEFLVSDYTNEVNVTPGFPDTTPAAPTGLTAVAVSASQVNLSWTAHPSSEIAYEIYRKPAGGSYILINDVGPGGSSFSDRYADSGIAYTYRVRAVSPTLVSDYTNEATVTSGP